VAKGTIENPVGFLVAFLKENRPLPRSFVSTRQRALLEAQWEAEQKEREALQARYEEHKSREVKKYVREQGLEEEYASRIEAKRATLRQRLGWPDEDLDRLVVRSVRDEFAQELPDLISEEEFLELNSSQDLRCSFKSETSTPTFQRRESL